MNLQTTSTRLTNVPGRSNGVRYALCRAICTVLAACILAGPVPASSQFWDTEQEIDTNDDSPTRYASAALNNYGDVVFAWTTFDEACVRTYVNFSTPGGAYPDGHSLNRHDYVQADVAIDPQGNWYLVVTDRRYQTQQINMVLYRYDDPTSTLAGPIDLVSPVPAWNDIHKVQIALSQNGILAVVWEGANNQPTSRAQVQLFNTSGAPIAPAESLGTGCCQYPDISIDSGGYSVVTWREGSKNIYAQVIRSNGYKMGSPFLVTDDAQPFSNTNVGYSDSSVVTFVWASETNGRICQQRFDRYGTALSPVVDVSSSDASKNPRMAKNPRGEYVIIWHEMKRVMGRRYDTAGLPIQQPVQMNHVTTDPRNAVVGISPDGHVAAAWEDQYFRCDPNFCGTFTDVYGRVLGPGLLATTFARFAAVQNENGVELSWEVESNDVILGFDVIRRESATAIGSSILAGTLLPAGARTYLDRDILPGSEYEYTVVAVTGDDNKTRSCPARVRVESRELVLGQNRPNPFNPTTRIPFYLPGVSEVDLGVYSVEGRLIRKLLSGEAHAGSYTIEWDGRDQNGNTVASGIYFYRIVARKQAITRKMVLVK